MKESPTPKLCYGTVLVLLPTLFSQTTFPSSSAAAFFNTKILVEKKISFLHLLICVYSMFYRKVSQTQLDMSMTDTTDENNGSYFAIDSSYSPTPLPLIANSLRHNPLFSLCLCSIYHGVTCDRPSGCCHCTSAGSCIPPLHPSGARNEGEQLENTTV